MREYIAGVLLARQQQAPFLLPESAFYEYNWILAHRRESASSACLRTFAPESHVRRVRDGPLCTTEELARDVSAIAASRPKTLPGAMNATGGALQYEPMRLESSSELLPKELFFDPAELSRLLAQIGFKAEELTQLSTPFCVFESAQLGELRLSMRQSATSASITSICPQDDLDARLFNSFNVSPPDVIKRNDAHATQSDRTDNSQRAYNLQDADDKTAADDVSLASTYHLQLDQRPDDNLRHVERAAIPPPAAPTFDDLDLLLQTLPLDERNELHLLPPNELAARLAQLHPSLQYEIYVHFARRQGEARRAANELIRLPDISNSASNPANCAEAHVSNELELRVEMATPPAGINGLMQKSSLSNNSTSSARDSREYSPLITTPES